jgi:ABC-type nitrate/sulfonate/bicarbonate transport system permease component
MLRLPHFRSAVREDRVRRPTSSWPYRVVIWGALLLLWQVLAVTKGPFFMATPLETLKGIGQLATRDYGPVIFSSLRQFVLGFLLAVAIGIPLGLVMGSIRAVGDFLSTYVSTLFVTPKETLLPFLIILFSVGFAYRVAVVVIFSVFIIIMQVSAGVRSVDAGLLEAARSFRLSKLAIFRKIVLPASAPYTISGIRLGLGFAIKGMVIAELWVFSGLGGLVHNFVSFRQLDLFFALVVVIVGAGVLAIYALERLERRVGRSEPGVNVVTVRSGGFWAWDYGGSRVVAVLLRALAVLGFFGLWELVGRNGDLFAVPPFTESLQELWTLISLGDIWMPTLDTLKVAATGFAIAAVLGIVVGSLVGLTRIGRTAVKPLVDLGLIAPMTLVIPVLSIYVGIDFRGKVTLVVLLSMFIIAVNTAAGISSTSSDLIETAAVFGIRGWDAYRKIALPHAFPSILTGLRLAVGQALAAALIGDLLLTVRGLGGLLLQAGDRLNMPQLLAIVLWVAVLGWALMELARYIDRRLLGWLYT